MGYTLEVIKVGSDKTQSDAQFIITDKDKNKMYFNSIGVIRRIQNPSGVCVTMDYDTSHGAMRLAKITDGAGRSYLYNYEDSDPNRLTSISDPAGRKTTFGYKNGYLVKITFADGKSVQLDYGGGLLKEIREINSNRAWIYYDSSRSEEHTSELQSPAICSRNTALYISKTKRL